MYDVIIVGGASAGLAAAIYTARQGMKTLVLTKDIGGQAILTSEIENYPGFKSISGPELMQRLQDQAAAFGAEFKYEEVKHISKMGSGDGYANGIGGYANELGDLKVETDGHTWFTVETMTEDKYECLSVILAFGKTPRDLGVSGEDKLVGRGVSYCAVCDAPLNRGRTTAVVGWGDPAMDAVMMLCPIASKVHFIFKSPQLIGNDNLLSRCEKEKNVDLVPNSVVIEILGDRRVEGIMVKNNKTGETKKIALDSIFVELGYIAKTDFVRNLVRVNEAGEIVILDKHQSTSCPGIFAAGDVTDTPYKQAITSAGDGAKAGLAAYNYIQRIRGRPVIRSDWKVKKEK
ncbi:MAG TPA: FAD-dependent oxidoreductase [Nitrososphaeraceae archaeon]|jgi:thioredoxin reductase (NADPH)|nr:FAD-dependent oxidoreductase [Nitrososphaeraceae archaeon]